MGRVNEDHIRPPYLFALGQLAFVTGDLIRAYYEVSVGVSAPFPGLADVAYVAAYPILAASLVLLVRSRDGARDRANFIDVMVIVTSAGSWAVFLANALSYAAVIAAFVSWKREPGARTLPPEHFIGAFRAGVRFAGTLTLPHRPRPSPAVLLIAGSGARVRFARRLGVRVLGSGRPIVLESQTSQQRPMGAAGWGSEKCSSRACRRHWPAAEENASTAR